MQENRWEALIHQLAGVCRELCNEEEPDIRLENEEKFIHQFYVAVARVKPDIIKVKENCDSKGGKERD